MLAFVGFDADVIEQPRLPEVEKVLLDEIGLVRLAGNDAEIDADGVAGDGGVAGGFESLDRLTGEAASKCSRRRSWYRRFGDDAAGLASRDDGSGFRSGRWLLLLRGLRGGGSSRGGSSRGEGEGGLPSTRGAFGGDGSGRGSSRG